MNDTLAGKRILIVEDEFFIAADLRRVLQDEGVIVVGPTGDLSAGLALASDEALDAAILDVNLDGAPSYPIAATLCGRSVPFLFVTGYDDWALDEAYRMSPRISKPCNSGMIVQAIEQMIAQ